MKRILLLAVFIIGAMAAQGQSKEQIERLADKEMDKLTKIVTYSNDNVAFTKNQTAKLERVLYQKATEIAELKAADIGKLEYAQGHQKIEKKYEPKVEELLTTVQRVEYKRNKNKRIPLKKD